jgi:hypothetical protein
MSTNIDMLSCVAHGLGNFKEDVVFVGGSVAELYAANPELSDIRPTLDVDCVVEISTYIAYNQLEEKLRSLGFQNDITTDAPICRKIYKGIIVDIMPVNPDILGFSNQWYRGGMDNKVKITLPDSTDIFVFPVEYYLATKLEALNNRGGNDIRGSHDMEDIVYVMNNCLELPDNIKQQNDTLLVQYLKKQFCKLLNNSNIKEVIYSSLPYNSEEENIDAIVDIMNEIVNEVNV